MWYARCSELMLKDVSRALEAVNMHVLWVWWSNTLWYKQESERGAIPPGTAEVLLRRRAMGAPQPLVTLVIVMKSIMWYFRCQRTRHLWLHLPTRPENDPCISASPSGRWGLLDRLVHWSPASQNPVLYSCIQTIPAICFARDQANE